MDPLNKIDQAAQGSVEVPIPGRVQKKV